MPLDDPARPRSFDPAVDLLGSALHDGAVVLDAYARFATTVINIALFPYAAIAAAKKMSEPAATGAPARPPHRGMVQVAAAFLIGVVLGRRLIARLASRVQRASESEVSSLQA